MGPPCSQGGKVACKGPLERPSRPSLPNYIGDCSVTLGSIDILIVKEFGSIIISIKRRGHVSKFMP
jgi:hypothetical protein